MTQSLVSAVFAWEALDSRGNPTVGCCAELAGGHSGQVIVPSGASTGRYEAAELRDGGQRYGGKGVRNAVRHVNDVLAPLVTGLDAHDHDAVDAAMEAVDGTGALERLGANAVLAVSVAVLLAAAAQAGQPLYRYLDASGEPVLLPMPMINIASGGAHAGGLIDIQDVLAVPAGAASFAQAIEWAWRIRRAVAGALRAVHGSTSALVADEGGLAARFGSNRAAVAAVAEGVAQAGLRPGEDVVLAVDVAAAQFRLPDGRYRLAADDRVVTAAGLVDEVAGWCDSCYVASVEDVASDDDWDGWEYARTAIPAGVQLLGDDLFATNLARLDRGIAAGIGNAVLVKPNQAGTLRRTAAVVRRAQQAGYATVISARSGDSEDSWLADLAIGWRAGQIKVGSLTRSERTAKWNRLLRLEAELGARAQLVGRDVLGGA